MVKNKQNDSQKKKTNVQNLTPSFKSKQKVLRDITNTGNNLLFFSIIVCFVLNI